MLDDVVVTSQPSPLSLRLHALSLCYTATKHRAGWSRNASEAPRDQLSEGGTLASPSDAELSGFLAKGVQPKTAKGHDRNLPIWDEFLRKKRCSHLNLLDGLNEPQKRKMVVEFIFHLRTARKFSPNQIKRALQSVLWSLTLHGRDAEWFSSDATVKLARKACRLTAREMNVAREKKRRAAVSYDMVQWIEANYSDKGVDSLMIVVGIVLAFHFLLRISEYVPHAENQHSIRGGDVSFMSYDGERIAPWMISQGDYRLDEIEGINVEIRSSKADTTGQGRHLFISRTTPGETHLMEVMFEWCQVANLQDDYDPFLCRYTHNRRKKLTPAMVNGALKTMAVAFGLDAVHFSSHCIKIGATTMMAGAEVDRGVIRRLAGWSREGVTDQIYAHNTPIDGGALSIIGSGRRIFSAKDVRRMIPVRRRR